ncbi:hypothetical protein GGI04_000015 [Coemansia thaxteri]|nr:hypothetical protein GGI04_000015 [Coemansia thaxteri]KAJ2474297.1 hypothetical protein GGI02_000190 [Coemansia sp. RSA 2322]
MVLLRLFILLSSIALAARNVLGMYGKGSTVKQLRPANFDRVLSKTSQPTFVKFYAPWCGHCKSLEPEYEKAAKRTQGVARFYAVDCDNEKNQGLCAQYNVQGFPTIKVFTEKRTKRGSRRSIDYQGERTASALAKFARSQLPNLSKKLAAADIDAFIGNATDKQPAVVLLTDLRRVSDLWKGVSAHFDRRVQFAHVSRPEQNTLERLGISKLPAIVVFPDPEQADVYVIYGGEAKYAPLAKFIAETALAKKPSTQAQAPRPAFDAPSVVEISSQADLERECIVPAQGARGGVLCVIGMVPLEPEFEESRIEHAKAIEELAAVASPPVRVAWANALSPVGRTIRAMFGLSDDLPSAVAISPSKNTSAPYHGAFDKASLLEWVDACFNGAGMQRISSKLDISGKHDVHDEL